MGRFDYNRGDLIGRFDYNDNRGDLLDRFDLIEVTSWAGLTIIII